MKYKDYKHLYYKERVMKYKDYKHLYYKELAKTPEMEDKYGAIIPPEDQMFCNNAEGCDNCKWNVVCFEEEV